MSREPQISDLELIERIRKGIQPAFRMLFDRHYKVLLGTAINMVRSEDIGKDIVQDVFLYLWKKRDELNITSHPGAYLKKMVINRCINHVQRTPRHETLEVVREQQQEDPDALDNLAYDDLNDALKAALERLPERCRLIFVMRRLEGMPVKEISESLDISPKTVENQITKALRELATSLKAYRKKREKE